MISDLARSLLDELRDVGVDAAIEKLRKCLDEDPSRLLTSLRRHTAHVPPACAKELPCVEGLSLDSVAASKNTEGLLKFLRDGLDKVAQEPEEEKERLRALILAIYSPNQQERSP
jgi:hypothetical protein